jgi:hypothetical protein
VCDFICIFYNTPTNLHFITCDLVYQSPQFKVRINTFYLLITVKKKSIYDIGFEVLIAIST